MDGVELEWIVMVPMELECNIRGGSSRMDRHRGGGARMDHHGVGGARLDYYGGVELECGA